MNESSIVSPGLFAQLQLDAGEIISIIFGIVVIVIAAEISRRLLLRVLDRAVQAYQWEKARYKLYKNVITLAIYTLAVVGIFFTIPSLRSFALTLFASAGILALVMGFASQKAFGNIMSGVFIFLFHPFRIGDFIEVGNKFRGTVEDITFRHTVLKGFENIRIIMPNSRISEETIINYTIEDPKMAKFIQMEVSHDANIDKAMEIMRQEAEKHPEFIDNRTDEEKEEGNLAVKVSVIGFGDSSVKLRAIVWAKDPMTARSMKFDLFKSIKDRFNKEGIEIPYPYRTIVYKKDLKQKTKS
jgi:small conductance mechanosensitive channel